MSYSQQNTDLIEKARQASLADFLPRTDLKLSFRGTSCTLKATAVYM